MKVGLLSTTPQPPSSPSEVNKLTTVLHSEDSPTTLERSLSYHQETELLVNVRVRHIEPNEKNALNYNIIKSLMMPTEILPEKK